MTVTVVNVPNGVNGKSGINVVRLAEKESLKEDESVSMETTVMVTLLK